MESPAKGKLAAYPPLWGKQDNDLALTISSELAGFTVHEHCTSLPRQAEISSFHRKPGLHSDSLLAEINFKTRVFKPQTWARTREARKPQHLLVFHGQLSSQGRFTSGNYTQFRDRETEARLFQETCQTSSTTPHKTTASALLLRGLRHSSQAG